MIPSKLVIRTMLMQMDCAAMARHSQANHHADGMNYLCLHRSDELTIKLYLMEKPENRNSGYLVNPHSHRYAFESMVLAGSLDHIRFAVEGGDVWTVNAYDCETKKTYPTTTCGLKKVVENHMAGDRYFVSEDEIHTLRVMSSGPLLLALCQFRDTRATSALMLPTAETKVRYPDSRQPYIYEVREWRDRALELLGAP